VKLARELLRGPRPRLLAMLAAVALAVTTALAFEVDSILARSVNRSAIENASEDARLIVDLGLAAALADGRLSNADRIAARKEIAAARETHPLVAVDVWAADGRVVFAAPPGAVGGRSAMPRSVGHALTTGRTADGPARTPNGAPAIEVAVPVKALRRPMVANFSFSRREIDKNIGQAKRRLLVVVGGAALIVYLALLPLLALLVRTLPAPGDPERERALQELRDALARDELCVHYQPKVDLSTDAIEGVEALVRWRHPARGLLGPAAFLPLAESEPDLMSALTATVFDKAASDCRRWLDDGYEMPVAVNVAAPSLLDDDLVELIRATLDRHRLDPQMLTVEITESAVMRRDSLARLERLRDAGVRISIDDFGTGHSSLARLRALPLHELKVDRSFVGTLVVDARDRAIVQLVVELGRNLGLHVVAEGVEDEAAVEILRELGCSSIQGFVIAPPRESSDLQAWAEAWQSRSDQVTPSHLTGRP
jgi:EAL domain-containing protein (putative c-di-GMP-specific phosphodiesterase class I)